MIALFAVHIADFACLTSLIFRIGGLSPISGSFINITLSLGVFYRCLYFSVNIMLSITTLCLALGGLLCSFGFLYDSAYSPQHLLLQVLFHLMVQITGA